MTARDRFLTAYNDPARCFCGGDVYCDKFEDLVDTLLREHAHELAEKIRGEAERSAAWWSGTDRTVPPIFGCHELDGACPSADLIDPEVT